MEFELESLVGDTVKALAFPAHEKGLELTYQVHADVPNILVGDPNSLRQILVNVVCNGIKFTDEGEVTVVVRLEARASTKQWSTSWSRIQALVFPLANRPAFSTLSSK